MGFLLVLLLGVLLFVLWLRDAVEIIRSPESLWRAAGERKQVYVVMILLFPIGIGSFLYRTSARPRLRRIAVEAQRRPV